MRRDTKIILISVFSIITLILFTLYFYYVWNTYTIHADFDNASGLSRLDDVSLAGLRIGSVWDLSFTRKRKVHAVLFIYNRYRDFIPADSTANIISGNAFSSGKYSVDITPGASSSMLPREGYVRTERTVELQDLMAKADVLANTMQRSFNAVDDLLGDPMIVAALKNSALNMDIASRKSVQLLSSLQSIASGNKARIPDILASVDTAASNFETMSRNLRRLTDKSVPILVQTTTDVSKAAHDFKEVSQGLRLVMQSANPADIQDTLKSAKAASENIEVVSSRLRLLTEDPSLAVQVKTMLGDLQKALSGATEVVDQVKKLLSEGKPETP
ncbi:MAG: MlaD family protein [Armatimonadota bacterium]